MPSRTLKKTKKNRHFENIKWRVQNGTVSQRKSPNRASKQTKKRNYRAARSKYVSPIGTPSELRRINKIHDDTLRASAFRRGW